jgi:hypothetical protein
MATETDKVNTGALATLVAVGTFSTIAIVLGVDALVRYETAQLSAERASHASERYRSLVAEQTGKLTAAPKWSDQSKGLVSMPIRQAMGHVVADFTRDPLSASPVPPADAGAEPSTAADAGAAETADGGAAQAPEGSPVPAAPPSSASPSASGAVPAPPSPAPPKAPAPTGAVSPKPSTVLAVPAAPPAAPPKAPAPAAPTPSDG